MTDKVQKIREEVERLMYGYNLEADIASCEDAETEKLADIKYQLCKNILDFINSMQEEPTSVWHDANTLPSDPKAVIVEHNEYSTSICRAEQMSRVKGAKWAYINDLLKL